MSDELRPEISANMAVGRAGDYVLFTIDTPVVSHAKRNSLLLALDWVNNIREALGVAPIPQADVQARQNNLAPTGETIEGVASWYGPGFHGRLTATGEVFNQNELTAAHPSLPFGTYLQVQNLNNGKQVIVRVNDRGPYISGRSLDLSLAAAQHIGGEDIGVIPFEARIMQPLPVERQAKAFTDESPAG